MPGFALIAFLPALAQPPAASAEKPAADGPYHVISTFTLGGEGGWDCLTLDAEGKRLYIPRGTHTMVMDTESGKVVGDIPDTAGVHDVALAPEFHKGFTSNGRSNTVTAFDTETLKPLGTAVTGANPDVIIYEPTTKHVWCFNGRGKDATVIDADSLSIVGTVPMGGKPELAAADGHGRIFVNVEDTSEVLCIDADKRTVEHRWPLAPGEEPSGLALDAANHHVFSACANQKMVVLDTESGKVVATPTIGKGPDGAAFDAAGFAISPNGGDGTITVISSGGDKPFEIVQTLKTAPRARTMAMDPKSRRMYLATAEFEQAKEGERRPAMKPGTFKIVVVGP